jgi:hypothetical protein
VGDGQLFDQQFNMLLISVWAFVGALVTQLSSQVVFPLQALAHARMPEQAESFAQACVAVQQFDLTHVAQADVVMSKPHAGKLPVPASAGGLPLEPPEVPPDPPPELPPDPLLEGPPELPPEPPPDPLLALPEHAEEQF